MEEPFFRFEKFSNFPEIIHGMSLRSYGDMKFGNRPTEEIITNRRAFFRDLGVAETDVICCQQDHGSRVVTVGKNERGKGVLECGTAIGKTDALISVDKDVFLMVEVADCLPVLVYDPVLKIVAAVHAGWRGIIDQIIPEVINQFRKYGSDLDNLIVGIGPSICQKHFIAKSSVLEKFKDLYPQAILLINKDGYVDLRKATFSDLKNQGVHPSNIEISNNCTICDNGTYSSYRKEGESVLKMAAVIGMRDNDKF